MWMRRGRRIFCPRRAFGGLMVALTMPLLLQAEECVAASTEKAAYDGRPVVTAAVSEAAGAAPLVMLSRGTDSLHAVVLIGGIYNDYRYFSPWSGCLARDDRVLLGWQRPHHRRPLGESARALAAEIKSLHGSGVRQVTMFAHSIGGLVAKGAVDILAQENYAHRFEKIVLHAFGTPWGGFAAGDLARSNPLGILVSWLAGHPVWLDIGTGSHYIVHLDQPLPSNGRLYHYISNEDTVAMPESARAAQRYASVLKHASAIIPLSGVDHDAYALNCIDASTHNRLDKPAQVRGMTHIEHRGVIVACN